LRVFRAGAIWPQECGFALGTRGVSGVGLAPVGAVRVQLVDRDKRPVGGFGGCFDRLAAARQAVDDGDHAGYLEALLADSFNRLYG